MNARNALSAAASIRLLLVDDEPDLLATMGEILSGEGFAVVSALAGEDAADIASLFQPHVLITDLRLSGIDGLAAIQQVRRCCPQARVILVSGHISETTRRRAIGARVDRILRKPVVIDELIGELRSLGPAS